MTGIGERDTTPRLGAVAPLQPGDPARIGRYVLSGRLGAGGMGTVYLGRASAGPAVAVKVVHPELAGDPEFRARFADEVAAARRVAPFCTARVVDADPGAALPYLVTEFVDGVPLSTAVAEGGPLDESTLHGVALGVAAALAAVHAAGVVHRDLKPGNVLLSLSGPRVIDFGIARALDAARQHTQVGMLVGTPGWMAPEQFRGGAVGPASDVFSWGSLVTYAATGHNPWQAGSAAPSLPPAAQAYKILHDEPDLTGLTGPLRRLVESALIKDPARRPTARQLVDALLGSESAPADPTRVAAGLVERTWTGLPTFTTGPSGPAAGRPGAPGRPVPNAPATPGSRAGGPVRPGGPAAGPYGTAAFGAGGHPGGPGRPGAGPARPAPRPPGPPPWSAPPQRGPVPPTRAFPPSTRVLKPTPAPHTRAAPAPAPQSTPQPAARPARRSLLRRRPAASPLPPAPPPPPAPVEQPRPRRRRRFLRKRLLVPIALLVGLTLLVPRSENPDTPTTGSQLGTPVRDGNLEFVVRGLRCGVPTVGTGPLKRTAAGQYCLAQVQVTNVKNEARTLFEPLQRLTDSGGDKHRADLTMRLVYGDQTLWDEIEPGGRVAGTMVFDIPAGRTPVALELHDGPLSGGARVRVK